MEQLHFVLYLAILLYTPTTMNAELLERFDAFMRKKLPSYTRLCLLDVTTKSESTDLLLKAPRGLRRHNYSWTLDGWMDDWKSGNKEKWLRLLDINNEEFKKIFKCLMYHAADEADARGFDIFIDVTFNFIPAKTPLDDPAFMLQFLVFDGYRNLPIKQTTPPDLSAETDVSPSANTP
jgi:hypothetical protein